MFHRGCGEKTGFGILVESEVPVVERGLLNEDGIGILEEIRASLSEGRVVKMDYIDQA